MPLNYVLKTSCSQGFSLFKNTLFGQKILKKIEKIEEKKEDTK